MLEWVATISEGGGVVIDEPLGVVMEEVQAFLPHGHGVLVVIALE